jgi:hypothetical protein
MLQRRARLIQLFFKMFKRYPGEVVFVCNLHQVTMTQRILPDM